MKKAIKDISRGDFLSLISAPFLSSIVALAQEDKAEEVIIERIRELYNGYKNNKKIYDEMAGHIGVVKAIRGDSLDHALQAPMIKNPPEGFDKLTEVRLKDYGDWIRSKMTEIDSLSEIVTSVFDFHEKTEELVDILQKRAKPEVRRIINNMKTYVEEPESKRIERNYIINQLFDYEREMMGKSRERNEELKKVFSDIRSAVSYRYR